MNDPTRIRDLVEVARHPTVVRFEHLEAEDARWITDTYHITNEARSHVEALRHLFARPTGAGVFVIGQYGAGKSHFLAWLTQRLRDRTFCDNGPDVTPMSLLNFRGRALLEDVVRAELGARDGEDRRDAVAAVTARHPNGLVLVIDELSEFLRAKPDAASFNEDIRFLQFLGEWAQGHRFWVVAAMQEQIEHVGELEHAQYRKIKDRYPIRLIMSPAHVRDLIGSGILRKKPGYEAQVALLVRRLREALPDAPVDWSTLGSLYPLHPATLDLLEEVRDLFSAARGVVDLVATQLNGDPARRISPFLDRPWGSLLTPEVIVDHFRDLLELQPRFQPLAQQVFPYAEQQLPRLFHTDGQRALAERLIKLLALLHLSPRREGMSVSEATSWLTIASSRIEPARNLQVVERVLETMAREGSYVKRSGERYALDLEDDGGAALERLIAREVAELGGRGDVLFETLAPLLEEARTGPFVLPRGRWQSRPLKWHLHDRPFSVYLGDAAPTAPEGAALVIRLPWGDRAAVPGAYTLVPRALAMGPEWLELAALARLAGEALPRGAAERRDRRLRDRLSQLADRITASYAEATIADPTGAVTGPIVADRRGGFAATLERTGEWILKRTYPSFERFAPTAGPLPREAYRALMRCARERDLCDPDAEDAVKVIREGYLVPMMLLARSGRDYKMSPKLDRNELVRLCLPLAQRHVSPRVIYEQLGGPVYGLVADQVHLLLVFLVIQGEIDLVKEGRSYRELFETFPHPDAYDEVVPARALKLEQIGELDRIASGLRLPRPRQWSVLAQRRAAAELREEARRRVAPLELLRGRLDREEQGRELANEIAGVIAPLARLQGGEGELEALERFLVEIGSAGRFVERLVALEGLPARIERQLGELGRLRHLLAHPALAGDEDFSARTVALGPPPSLSDGELMDRWLERALSLYQGYRQGYGERHERFWQEQLARPAWRWAAPAVSASRHIGLEAELDRLRQHRERAERLRCVRLVDLDFQPLCACGFDGRTAPVAEALDEIDHLAARIDAELRRFFADAGVRAGVGERGLDGSAAYLEGAAPWPEVADLNAFDRQLAGLDVVTEVDLGAVLAVLRARAWEPAALAAALRDLFARLGATRLRFTGIPDEERSEILLWCGETALRHGVPLPPRLRPGELERIAAAIRPEWIGATALARLDKLGLSDVALDRVVSLLLDGELAWPRERSSALLVEAARELAVPSACDTPARLAELSALMYRSHAPLARIAEGRWLARLEQLASSAAGDLPLLTSVLGERRDASWLVLDCLGLPLLGAVREHLGELLPGWRLDATVYAQVAATTTTMSFYRELAAAGINHPLEKLNGIDRIIHERFPPFVDLCRLVVAELHLALGAVRRRLDPARPLLIFGDHGFRLARDGRSYVHGGPSTLERVVPVLLLSRV